MPSAHFTHDPTSVRKARAFVAGALEDASEDQRDRAVLITSELATNAILHADSAFTVTATTVDGEIRIAVTDTGGAIPRPRRPDRTDSHGRGLLITGGLADRWGVETTPGSTTVWFSLRRTPDPARQDPPDPALPRA